MTRSHTTKNRYRTTWAAAATASVLTAAVLAGCAAQPDPFPPVTVTNWVQTHAVPLDTVDPAAPPTNLAALGESVGHAQIVGLGESAHGLSEITDLKHRTIRYLVEKQGFRTIAWEEDWSLGTQIDEYILGTRDDRDTLIAQMAQTWQTEDVVEVLDWLREYNQTHDEKVRFFGVEYFATRPFVYDNIESYVAQHAPHLLGEVRGHLTAIRPTTDNMGEYLQWFMAEVQDKPSYVTHAEELHALVTGIAPNSKDADHAEAEHASRQIVSFYTAFAATENIPAFRDEKAAENLIWWQKQHGGKTIYWAATAHSANAPEVTFTLPSQPATVFASVGSFLNDKYGENYVSIGYTFTTGTLKSAENGTMELPAPAEDWFEHPLGEVSHDQFLIDLHEPLNDPARQWVEAPMITRGYPEAGPESTATGGTPAEWFDVIVHQHDVTPSIPFQADGGRAQ